MSKTNYLQAVISDLQRTAGPYRCANRRHHATHSITSSASASRVTANFATTELMASFLS